MSTYYVAGVPYSSELYHHGIKGQRWGIRRFQNPDRSLTPAGKERYRKYSSDPEKTASWIHEASYASTLDKGRRERMLNAIEPALQEASSNLRKNADSVLDRERKHAKASDDVNRYVQNNHDALVKQLISKKELSSIEKDRGGKYTGWDGHNSKTVADLTISQDVRDLVKDRFSRNANHDLVKRERAAYRELEKELRNYDKACKDYVNTFLGSFGDDSAASIYDYRPNKQIITVGESMAEIVNRRAMSDASYDAWAKTADRALRKQSFVDARKKEVKNTTYRHRWA